MKRAHSFTVSSRLAASADRVWAHATSMRGVNRELLPLARMTYPTEFAKLEADRVPLGERLFRSWILAFGVLPIDYDDVGFSVFEPGKRFLESSRMWTQETWEHERTIEPEAGGVIVTDRVRFVPRVALLGAFFLVLFRTTFRLRHRNLKRLFRP